MSKKWYHKNFTIDSYGEIPSTNSLIFDLAKKNQINHNHIITAQSQTDGRGRYSRSWNSPKGNLYFSLLLKPQKNILESLHLSFVAAVSMGQAILEINEKAKINYKWPNDILLNKKKFCGILLESNNEKENNFVLLGIGANINSSPENTAYPATNLVGENLPKISPEELLKKFLDNFSVLYQKWSDFGFAPIRNLWLSKAFNLNKEILVNLPKEKIKGVFCDLDNEGNLVLEIEGVKKLISSGEVFVVNY